MFDAVDTDAIIQIAILAKILHDRAGLIGDLNVHIDTANTGLAARINAMSAEDAQAAFNAIADLHGMTYQEWLDIAYVITAGVKPVLDNSRPQLAPIFKYR